MNVLSSVCNNAAYTAYGFFQRRYVIRIDVVAMSDRVPEFEQCVHISMELFPLNCVDKDSVMLLVMKDSEKLAE